MKKLTITILLVCTSALVLAENLGRTIHVNRVFSEGASTAGFYPVESLPECKWGLMYIDLSTEGGKAIFSLVLTAKTAGHAVIRVDYTKDSSDKCLVTGFHTQ
ncbi:hypothetical protein [Reinekea sp. G2M2-21]|uniref:hypothetical protein n=1 Tax=Reinekea sp. G2M2-21 TaxID=2788942 RepID=UPI0018AB7ED2|nr:hypothetical protein [Reinekea sp. G2M2-21]